MTAPIVGRTSRAAAAVALAAAAWLNASCGSDTAEKRSLCSSFEQLVITGAAIRASDVSDLTAGEASDLAEAYQQRVTQVQEVADGRYGAELDALEQTVDDLVRTLSSIQDDADFATWAPLVEDSLEDVSTASRRVEQAIEPSCAPAPTEE